MQAKDWFSVGARLFGLWVLFYATSYGVSYAGIRLGFLRAENPLTVGEASDYLVAACWHFGYGSLLLFRADDIARYLFVDPRKKSGDVAISIDNPN